MRMQPIERPSHWAARLAYWYSRRVFGKVLTTLKVLYARKPQLLRPYSALLGSVDKSLSLEPTLCLLVKVRVAELNGCAFCGDIARHRAAGFDRLAAQLAALGEHRMSPLFDARERAALAYVEEATRHRRVEDSTYERLKNVFSEPEIVELTWLNAAENFLNLTTIPLGIGSDGLCEAASRAPVRG
jgi:AhpD family alkylhydroperoxidase